MPVLTDRFMYPYELLDGIGAESDSRQWHVLYTKARQEKALAKQLFGFEIPFYLPVVPMERLYRGRRIVSRKPLFSGYVFLFGTEEERVQCLKTQRLSQVLQVDDQDALYRDLKQIHHLIASEAPLTIERRLMPGRQVRVRSGSFAGLEGTVTSRVGRTRLIVAVDYLHQGVSLEIDDFLLEPID